MRNSGSGVNSVFSRLGAEKKKTVMALCLIGVMVFMWTRLLGKKTPRSAKAAPAATETNLAGESNLEPKISFIELPTVAGRNDVLTRDFFAVNDWKNFITDGEGKNLTNTKENGDASKNNSEELVRRITEKLNLKAIELGKKPQAFINYELLSVGDKLQVRDGDNTYECEVVGIEENKVSIRCGEVQIELELIETGEAND